MKSNEVDILILGQGFAGTALGILCAKRGIPFRILADSAINSASKAAVGLVNPVTGRRMAKTWNCDEIFPFSFDFYEKAYRLIFPESASGETFLKPSPIFKALHSFEEINHIEARSAWPEFQSYLFIEENSKVCWPPIFQQTAGWCRIEKGGRLKVESYLDVSSSWFKNRGELIQDHFNFEKLEFNKSTWHYGDQRARFVVSCLGMGCPWVSDELIPVKGQVLEISGLPDFGDRILKTDKFFLPVGNGNHLCGSTYEKHFSDVLPDEMGQNEILESLRSEFRETINIEQDWAGIRPTTQTRRPIIRQISEGLFALNGMGTKGVTLSPWGANELLKLIFQSKN